MFDSDLDLDDSTPTGYFEPEIWPQPDISTSLNFSKDQKTRASGVNRIFWIGYFKTEPEYPVLLSRAHVGSTVLAITFAYFIGLR